LIEKTLKINTKIKKILTLNFEKIYLSKSDFKSTLLTELFWFQEGPGIRNWQYVTEKGIKFINIKCINEDILDLQNANMISVEEATGMYKHFLVEEKDVLVSTSGTLGRNAIVRKCNLPLCMNTSVIRFKPKNENLYSFMYCYLNSLEFITKLNSMANGSAQLNFGPTHLKQIEVFVPSNKVLQQFNLQNLELINIMIRNYDKIDELTKIKKSYLDKFFR